LHDSISAKRLFGARPGLTSPASFRLTSGGTAVARIRRIAGFTLFNAAVPTREEGNAFLPRNTFLTGILGLTVRGTARTSLVLALIANLSRIDDTVSTSEAHSACPPRGWARVIRLLLAGTAAAITGECVAIIALLAQASLYDRVAATRRGCTPVGTPCSDSTARCKLESAASTTRRRSRASIICYGA